MKNKSVAYINGRKMYWVFGGWRSMPFPSRKWTGSRETVVKVGTNPRPTGDRPNVYNGSCGVGVNPKPTSPRPPMPKANHRPGYQARSEDGRPTMPAKKHREDVQTSLRIKDFCDEELDEQTIEKAKAQIMELEAIIDKYCAKGGLRTLAVFDKMDDRIRNLYYNIYTIAYYALGKITSTYGEDFKNKHEGVECCKRFIDTLFDELGIKEYSDYITQIFVKSSPSVNFARLGFCLFPKIEKMKQEQEQKEKGIFDQYNSLSSLAEKKSFIKNASPCYEGKKNLREKMFPGVALPKIPYGSGTNELIEAISGLSDEDKILYCYMLSLEKAARVGEKTEQCQELFGNRRRNGNYTISNLSAESDLWVGYLASHVAKRISENSGIKDESVPEQLQYRYNYNYAYNVNISLLLWHYLNGAEGIFTEFEYAGEKVTLSGNTLFSVDYWQKIQPKDAYCAMKSSDKSIESKKDNGQEKIKTNPIVS